MQPALLGFVIHIGTACEQLLREAVKQLGNGLSPGARSVFESPLLFRRQPPTVNLSLSHALQCSAFAAVPATRDQMLGTPAQFLRSTKVGGS